MAEKRMISKVISISEKVNSLPDLFDMLLFTWIIPHSDDFGRLSGSPAKVKALVVPMLDKSVKDVEQSLQRLHDANLIIWYEINSDKYIQITNFEEHQSGLHKRTKSKFPEYIPGTSGNFRGIPLEENRTEENGIEGNRTEENGNVSQIILNLINKLNLKTKGVWEVDQVVSFIGIMDAEVVEEALRRSEHKGRVDYAIGILNNWNAEGIKSLTDLKPKGGQANEGTEGKSKGVQPGSDQETSGSESITGGQTGWLNSKYNQGNVIPMPNVSG